MLIEKLAHLLGKRVMRNDLYAFQFALLFSLLPHCQWLAVAIASLVTLRKGAKSGLLVFSAPVVWHLIQLHGVVFEVALLSITASFVYPYAAALILRATASWSVVAVAMTLFAALVLVLILTSYPEANVYLMGELKEIMAKFYESGIIQNDAASQQLLINMVTHFLLGLHVMMLMLATVTSLLVARAIQSGLYHPGGFTKELKYIKGHWSLLLLFVLTLFGTYEQSTIASNLLPVLCSYFIIIGLSASYYFIESLAYKKMNLMIASLLFVLLFPLSVVPLLVVGIVDNIFNFRVYEPSSEKLGGKI